MKRAGGHRIWSRPDNLSREGGLGRARLVGSGLIGSECRSKMEKDGPADLFRPLFHEQACAVATEVHHLGNEAAGRFLVTHRLQTERKRKGYAERFSSIVIGDSVRNRLGSGSLPVWRTGSQEHFKGKAQRPFACCVDERSENRRFCVSGRMEYDDDMRSY